MTKFDIHDELGDVMLLPPSEGNRELSDEEAAEYQGMMEHVLAYWKSLIDKRKNGKTADQ